ncbi:MAG: hypothetical protein PQJ50_14740 [Spirochaetales bacterium]|nr:hypothetical protein [Spirochaetales bacterium]
MPYCSRCGVEVHDEAVKCPLCRSPIQKFNEDPAPGRTFPEDELTISRRPRMNRKEKLNLSAVITTFGMLVPVLITLAVDRISNGSIGWSLYPVVSLIACLLLVLNALFSRRPAALIWISFLVLIGAMETMAALKMIPSSAADIADPIIFFAALCSQATVTVSVKSKRKGGNIAAFILIAVGLFCMLTDIWLSWKIWEHFRVSWSLIVLAATQPITLILLYLHYRKSKNGILKKYFHI